MLSLGFRNGDVASRPWVWDPEMVVEAGRARRSLHVPRPRRSLKATCRRFSGKRLPSLTSLRPSVPGTETEQEAHKLEPRVLAKLRQPPAGAAGPRAHPEPSTMFPLLRGRLLTQPHAGTTVSLEQKLLLLGRGRAWTAWVLCHTALLSAPAVG